MKINLIPKVHQVGTKTLEGKLYQIIVKWNQYAEVWMMDLIGISDKTINIKGIALLPGMDLLSPYGFNKRLGELWMIDNSGINENPNFDEIGGRFTLEYIPISELA